MVKIDIISTCIVGMASINANPMSRLELTPWDLKLLLRDPIQTGILFHRPQSQQINGNFIDQLKNSLSRALELFPPLAGRLATIHNDDNTTSFFVDCNNAGVEFTHAVAEDVSVSDILEPTYIPEVVYSFFPLNGIPNCDGVSNPLFGVQLTKLLDGLFIGCTANHSVVDGPSFWHFVHSWSEISRGLGTLSKTPVFERWFPSSVAHDNRIIRLPPLEQNLLPNSVPPPLLERVFHFSKQSVANLKAKANAEAGTDKISSLQALTAHLWQSYARCRRSRQSIHDLSSQEACLIMVVGARARIPLPEGYFGNALDAVLLRIREAELLQNGLGYAALKINGLVAQKTKETIVKSVEDWVENPVIHRKGISNSIFFVTGSPRHNVYDNDFGWGKPIAVRTGIGQKSDGKVIIYPGAVSGGIDAQVCFPPETLRAMGDDAEFMEAFNI